MEALYRLASDLVHDSEESSADNVSAAARAFIEAVTFAPTAEIVSAIRRINSEDLLALPVWARNLAFRIACLQEPGNARLLREAASDLLYFGPEWDEIASGMQREADRLDARENGPRAT